MTRQLCLDNQETPPIHLTTLQRKGNKVLADSPAPGTVGSPGIAGPPGIAGSPAPGTAPTPASPGWNRCKGKCSEAQQSSRVAE